MAARSITDPGSAFGELAMGKDLYRFVEGGVL